MNKKIIFTLVFLFCCGFLFLNTHNAQASEITCCVCKNTATGDFQTFVCTPRDLTCNDICREEDIELQGVTGDRGGERAERVTCCLCGSSRMANCVSGIQACNTGAGCGTYPDREPGSDFVQARADVTSGNVIIHNSEGFVSIESAESAAAADATADAATAGQIQGTCACSECGTSEPPAPSTITLGNASEPGSVTSLLDSCLATCSSSRCTEPEVTGQRCVSGREVIISGICEVGSAEETDPSIPTTLPPTGGGKTVTLTNPLRTTDIPTIIGRIIKALLGIVGSIALLMFVYGGFTWLTSGGSPEQVKKGRNIIVWATIGLAVIFISYILVNFVINALTSAGS